MAGKLEAGPTSDRVAVALRRTRQERGLTYAELSRRLAALGHPILDTGLMKIEKGQRRVDVDDLMALAIALGCTPNQLLLPEVHYARPDTAAALTPGGDKVRAIDAWAWASGERPLGHRAASQADNELAADELDFLARNRRHYFRGGFGWLGSTADWLEGGQQAGKKANRKIMGAGLIAGAILGAFTRCGLDTRQIRQAAESAIAAALIAEEPEEGDRAMREVYAWLAANGDEEAEP